MTEKPYSTTLCEYLGSVNARSPPWLSCLSKIILENSSLAESRQPGETLQQPKADALDAAGQEHHPSNHQQRANNFFHDAEMIAETLHETDEGLHRQRRHDEREAKAQRIDGEQASAMQH